MKKTMELEPGWHHISKVEIGESTNLAFVPGVVFLVACMSAWATFRKVLLLLNL
jgi:hypothetical protein